MTRYFLVRAGSHAEGTVIQDPAICARAARATGEKGSDGKPAVMLVVKRRGGGYYAMSADGPEQAGEFSCVAVLDAELRYLRHECS